MNAWLVGYLVGGVVVLVVVVVVLALIASARRLAGQAEEIVAALQQARAGTAGLWQLSATGATADRIVHAATRAREALAGPPGTGGAA